QGGLTSLAARLPNPHTHGCLSTARALPVARILATPGSFASHSRASLEAIGRWHAPARRPAAPGPDLRPAGASAGAGPTTTCTQPARPRRLAEKRHVDAACRMKQMTLEIGKEDGWKQRPWCSRYATCR